MEHLTEFVSNHIFLVGALAVVLAMLIKSEYEHQTSKAQQLDPTKAVRLMNDEDVLILDIRESAEFGNGHIKNASNVPISALKEKLKDFTDYKDKAVITYCNSGNASRRAIKLLAQSGYNRAYNLAGGLNAWRDANLPTAKK